MRHLLDSVSSTNSASTIHVSSAFFEKSEFLDRLNERWVETATAMRTRQTDTKPPTTTSICETTGFESQKKKIVSHFIGVSRASFNLARGASIYLVAFGQWKSRNYFSFSSRPFLDILRWLVLVFSRGESNARAHATPLLNARDTENNMAARGYFCASFNTFL